MKKKGTLCLLLLSAALYAAPVTQVTVQHPVTAGNVQMPHTNVAVSKPTTHSTVSHPTTTVQTNLPRTQVAVLKPTTHSVVTHPTTAVEVTHPTTTAKVNHPVTDVSVTHPTTVPVMASATAGDNKSSKGGKMGSSSASGSYEASYKNVKDFAAANIPPADIPKAAKLSGGEAGLGLGDAKSAEKEALAAKEKPKAESAEASIEDVLKKTQLPSGLDSKLKQRAFEAGGLDKHGKKK